MPDVVLIVVRDRGNRPFISVGLPAGNPCFRGDGEYRYLCGECDAVIGENMPAALPIKAEDNDLILLSCNSCQSYNELPYSEPASL